MPTTTNGDVSLHYAVEGSGPSVVFVNDAGFGAWLWSYLQPQVAGPYRTVVWDLRGTGDSDAPTGPYALETLVDDLDAIVEAIDARHVHLVGMGLGGVIALEYARHHAQVASLAVIGAAEGEAIDGDALSSLAVPRDDPDALGQSLDVAFAPDVVETHAAAIDRIAEWRADDDADPAGWEAHRAAWTEATISDRYEITTPALVMSASDDRIVDPAATARLAEDLPRGRHRRIDGGHLAAVSENQVVGDELLAWLAEHTEREV
ncbi:MAG: alpha/beta fold hydrolase [Halorhabdus sp.]